MQAKANTAPAVAAASPGSSCCGGEADIGIQQMAELMAVSGIDVVGPLPAPLQSVTPFTAAIPTGASHPDAAAP